MKVLFESKFHAYATVRDKSGEILARVPSCQWWDDPNRRIVKSDDGKLIIQEEEFKARGTMRLRTDKWETIKTVGNAKDLKIEVNRIS